MQSARMEAGARFWSFVWFNVAERVVELAARTYGLDRHQEAALRAAFLRPNDYQCVARSIV